MTDKSRITFKSFIREMKEESFIILFMVPVVLTVWVYFGKQDNFAGFFPYLEGRWNVDACMTLYEYLAAFFLMFCMPFLILKKGFGKSLRDYGLRLGDWSFGLKFVAIAGPVVLLAAYVGSGQPDMQAEYPLTKSMMGNPGLFFFIEIFYILYYLGWEFLFRGVMVFGLETRFGAVAAVLIQTIPSAIVHIGKPPAESFGAILAGLVFGYLAVRTRSIFYPLILHAMVGIGTDLFVSLRVC